MIQLPGALLEPPAPAPHGKEPPGSPPDTPFSTVLDDHQARTAVAEGHQRDDSPSAPDGERDAQAPADREVAGDRDGERADRDGDGAPARPAAQSGPATAALAALLGGVPLPVDARAVVARLPGAASVAGAAAGSEPGPLRGRVLTTGFAGGAPPGARTPVSDRGTCVLTATRPIGVPADAAALPMRPAAAGGVGTATASSPSLPIGLGAAAAEGRGAAAGAAGAGMPGAAARAARLADVLQAATARPPAANVAAEQASAPAPATVAGAAAHPAAPARSAQSAATAATVPAAAPTVSTATDAQAAATADPAATRGVGLEHAVETVRLALRAAADRGVTHARISLNPRELGSIEVHLRQTADGLVARVVAQHAAAAQLLHDQGADLRRQLEQSGLNVLRLDIGASNDDARRPGARAFAPPPTRQSAPAADDPLAPSAATTETTATATLALPNGALVDVLA